MKKLSDLRESTASISEALRPEYVQKVKMLIKLGLINSDKGQILIRALGKGEVSDLTLAEKDILIRAFESLMNHVIDDKQVFQKVRQSYTTSSKLGEEVESTVLNESFVRKPRGHLGFDEGEYSDHVHDKLTKQGYKKVADGHYRHSKDDNKEVVLASKDNRVAAAMMKEDFANSDRKIVKKAFPVLILLRRKAIRLFPDGQKVGLYYADKLDRFFSIPSTGDAMTEEIDVIQEAETFKASPGGEHSTAVMSALKGIVSNKEACRVTFRNGSKLKVDMLTAHAILTVYGRLSNPENQVKFDKMLNKDNAGFMKVLDFVHKHYISGGQ